MWSRFVKTVIRKPKLRGMGERVSERKETNSASDRIMLRVRCETRYVIDQRGPPKDVKRSGRDAQQSDQNRILSRV